jgi:hypothetical protein
LLPDSWLFECDDESWLAELLSEWCDALLLLDSCEAECDPLCWLFEWLSEWWDAECESDSERDCDCERELLRGTHSS